MYYSVHFLYLGMFSLMAVFCYSCYKKSVENSNLIAVLVKESRALKIRETGIRQKLADATVKSTVLEQFKNPLRTVRPKLTPLYQVDEGAIY